LYSFRRCPYAMRARLNQHPHLFGQQAALADMAIALLHGNLRRPIRIGLINSPGPRCVPGWRQLSTRPVSPIS